ncbi:MAG: hypothetical protein ACE5EP_00405 [Candidatus Methylomirabilales bacterium]
MSKQDIEALHKELSALRKEVHAVRLAMGTGGVSMEEVLRRRGISIARSNPGEDLLFPSRLSARMVQCLYDLLKKYSFRLFLRDVLVHRDYLAAKELTRFCSPQTAGEYLEVLRQARVVHHGGRGRYRLAKEVQSFGPTLEWFVAQVFVREFSSPAMWGVRLLDMAPGGDYDVLTLVEGELLYVEVKSSPPKHIEQREIAAFLDRVEGLIPNAAFFFVDTELRMKDKIVVMFEEEFRQRGRTADLRRVGDEFFLYNDRIYVVNSRPGIVSNLSRCLRYWLGNR